MDIPGYIFVVLFLFPSIVSSALLMTLSTSNVATLSENTIDEVELTVITLTGAAAGTNPECALNPSSTLFETKLVPDTGQWSLHFIARQSLDFDATTFYSLTLECTDGVETVTQTFTVNVNNNKSPTVSNLNNFTSISADTSLGVVIFSVMATDDDNDTLYYSTECYVLGVLTTSCPVHVFHSGDVVVNGDLQAFQTPNFELRVTVNDSHGNAVGPLSLAVTVTGINNAPVMNKLPYTVVVLENSLLGSSVFQTDITDADVGDSHTYSAVFSPPEALNYFTLNTSNGLLSTSSSRNIDYDTLPFKNFTVQITVSDGIASDSGELTVNIANLNEAPQLAKAQYTLYGNEALAGTPFGTPNYGATDPEGDTPLTYGTDCTTFNIDSTTGQISLSIDYDRENTALASSVTCSVSVSDGSLSSAAVFEAYILNINDNTPQFVQNSYSFHVNPYETVGTIVGSVSAIDHDIESYGVVSYEVLGGAYDNIFNVDHNGNVYVRSALNGTLSSTTATIVVRASDIENLTDDVTVSLVMEATTTVSTTTTTDRPLTFFTSPPNVAWFAALMVLLLGLICYLTWELLRNDVLFKLCARCNECKINFPKPRRRMVPRRPPQKRRVPEIKMRPPPEAPPPIKMPPPDIPAVEWKPWNEPEAGLF